MFLRSIRFVVRAALATTAVVIAMISMITLMVIGIAMMIGRYNRYDRYDDRYNDRLMIATIAMIAMIATTTGSYKISSEILTALLIGCQHSLAGCHNYERNVCIVPALASSFDVALLP